MLIPRRDSPIALSLLGALLISSCASRPPCIVHEKVGELALAASIRPAGGSVPGALVVDLDLKNVSSAPIRIAMTPVDELPVMFGLEVLADDEWQPVDLLGQADERITAEFLTLRPGESVHRTLRLSAAEVGALAGRRFRALYLLATSDNVWSGVVFSDELAIPSDAQSGLMDSTAPSPRPGSSDPGSSAPHRM